MRSIERTDRIGRRSRGVTLLELLIVMVIMLMVTAAAIPMIAPAMRNRQMREATRLVSAYFGAARARSVQTGRPVGIMIERLNGGAFALQMSQVEVPAPYGGDTTVSKMTVGHLLVSGTVTGTASGQGGRVRITTAAPLPSRIKDGLLVAVSGVNGTTEANGSWRVAVVDSTHFDLQGTAFINPWVDSGTFQIDFGPYVSSLGTDIEWQSQLRYGDQVRFDYRGKRYIITSVPVKTPAEQDPLLGRRITASPPGNDTDGYWFLAQASGDGIVVPNGYTTNGVAYQIFRQPVRSSAQPLILPEGIVVDLSVSGLGSQLFNTRDYAAAMAGSTTVPAPLVNFDPIIIFSPSGRLDYVTNPSGQLVRPTGSVNLLLGRRELMFDVTTKGVAADIVFQNLSAPPPDTDTDTLMPPAENFWMTIGYQTGQVSVSQVAPHLQDYKDMAGVLPMSPKLFHVINQALNGSVSPAPAYTGALSFAKESQSLGGR